MKYGVLTKFNSSTRRIRWPSELAQNVTFQACMPAAQRQLG
jgi:hypothetical protein